MTQLTDVQVANVAVTSGWRGNEAVKAVAVALAESSGDDSKRGDLALQTAKWGPSVGLWQIRTLKAERGHGTDRDELTVNNDAVRNGAAAFHIYTGANNTFQPWSTFIDGQYLLYMGRAKDAVAHKTVNDDGSVSGHSDTLNTGPLAAAANAVKLAAKAGGWIADSHNWLRVGLAVAGAGMMVGGLLVVARPAVQEVVNDAVKG